MTTLNRRYDIDWLRVIAIGLLLLYHSAIGFQPWGIMLGFVTNDKPWPALWIPMMMLNIWRIPLLFFVSGMGVYFSMQSRTWKQLIAERALRVLVPYVFGVFAIVPVYLYIWQTYNNFDTGYSYAAAHLWFLGNIFVYVLVLSPLFYFLVKNEEGNVSRFVKKVFSTPLGLVVVIALLVTEVMLVNPGQFALYAETWHGFFLGLLAFLAGFCFVFSGDQFWKMLTKWFWLFLIVAIVLLAQRMMHLEVVKPNYLLMIESCCWIFSVFALGYKYLNRPGKALKYLSEAVLPVYILHMVFQALFSSLIFSMDLAVELQFVLIFILTMAGSLTVYELVKRVSFIRPLFGLKLSQNHSVPKTTLATDIK